MIVTIIDFIEDIPDKYYSHKTLESYFFIKLLKENGYSVNRNNILGIEDFIVIRLSQPNFFGGIIKQYKVNEIKKIIKSEAKIYFLANDPRIKLINYANVYKKRGCNITDEQVILFDNVIKNSTAIFSGQNYTKFHNNDLKSIHVNYFAYIFYNILQINKHNSDISLFSESYNYNYDFVYYGDNRGKYRHELLLKYIPKETNNIIIAYKKLNGNKKLKHNQLLKILNKCKTSLIISDKEHQKNVLTYRYYEVMMSNCFACIPFEYCNIDYAPKDNFISSNKDIEYIINNFDSKLIVNQNKFIETYLEQFSNLKIVL